MMMNSNQTLLWRVLCKPRICQPVRASGKFRRPEWYQYRRPTEPHELAKEFFDDLYSKRFGKDWPSIRCAMLSRKKYAAIMNNFSSTGDTDEEFIENGATDIVQALQDSAAEMCELISRDIEDLKIEIMAYENDTKTLQSDRDVEMNPSEFTKSGGCITSQDGSKEMHNSSDVSSPELILQERLDWLLERQETYRKLSETCSGLQVFAYPKANLTEFPDPFEVKAGNPLLRYFLLDGSSILPILALDPQPHDDLFDTCAAPGGKLMCMMQICKDGTGTIVANDVIQSRSSRIRRVVDEYIPRDSSMRQRMKITTLDVTDWERIETAVYDKVLVDVPCTTDRHSMFPSFEQRDNIFSQLRKRERARLPELQSEILRSAILSCKPGGSVVYSTCTASLQQNEYVVQMTVQHMLENHGVSCKIEDLTPLSHLLKDHFHFFKETELGILALPFLDANYGPTYVCKILRTR